jgi:rhodanese-related sulfurtransferase
MNILTRLFGAAMPEVDVRAVQARLEAKNNSPLVLDVREPNEFRGGHIPGARLIPLGSLSQRMPALPRNREIVCVCRSGSRSRSAVSQLTAAGYQAVNLRGGMIAWSSAGLPVHKGDR